MFLIFRTVLLVMMTGLFIALVLAVAYALGRRFERSKQKGKWGALPSDEGVRDMLLEGRVEEAIEAYRKFTGVDRFTAQKAVEDIQRELRLANGIEEEVQRLLKSGDKAAAIEAYQVATNAPLAEALKYVEKLEGRKK